MTCDSAREKLTAYLDGELEGERGSAIRGHLRGCDACRAIAADEAALRDGLRSLPPLDPPATLWAGVQARLAAEEVKDSERPAWGRALAWLRLRAPQLALGSVALAAAIVLLVVRMQRDDGDKIAITGPREIAPIVIKPDHYDHVVQPQPEPPRTGACDPMPADDGDVAAVVAAQPAKTTECYAQAARELIESAKQARGEWSDDRKHDFDAEVTSLQKSVALATDERPRQQAYRKLIRFLQRAIVRDDVAIANLEGPQ